MLRKYKILLGVIGLLGGMAPTLEATEWHVDATAACPGSGTIQSPWCEIYRAFGNGPGSC